MKKSSILILTIVTIAIATLTIGAGSGATFKPKKSSDSILGTWQLASYKYGTTQSGFTDVSKSLPHLKLITDTHFTWTTFDTYSHKVISSAGGTYTLEGNTYIESIDFGFGMDSYLGQKQTFTVKVEGNMFFMSGSLSDGYKIEEIWQRVK